jgi:predicted NAD/FAD-binding protein
MKIAIIGAGISGNTIAWHLHEHHEITVFEAEQHIGGHSHTHQVNAFGKDFNIDTGFIVYNDWTYPNFINMLNLLGVETQSSAMSFSVRDEATGLEYNGTSLNSLFAQRMNLIRPSFLGMIKDILRFNKEAPLLLSGEEQDIALGEYLIKHHYGQSFIKRYIIPMGSAIWSADPEQMFKIPAKFFIRFFHNHGMLSVSDRPEWRVIKGGSQAYVEKLTSQFKDRVKLNTAVEKVTRFADGVMIESTNNPQNILTLFSLLAIVTKRSPSSKMLQRMRMISWAPFHIRIMRLCCTQTAHSCPKRSSLGQLGIITSPQKN